jgi:hypothetical protein
MARPSKLSSLSIDALFKLRDAVAAALDRRAEALKKELAALGSDYAEVGRIAVYGRKSLKGRRVAHEVPGPGFRRNLGRPLSTTPMARCAA